MMRVDFFVSQPWQGPLLIAIVVCVVLAVAFKVDS
jgi:hypothetical protein